MHFPQASAADRWPLAGWRARLRRRGPAAGLALAVELLIGLMLAYALMPTLRPKPPRVPLTFGLDHAIGANDAPTVVPDAKPAQRTAPQSGETRARPAEAPRPQAAPSPAPSPLVETTPATLPANFVRLTRRDFAASDLARQPAGAAASTSERAEAAGGGGGVSADSAVVGKGPRGETLYAADWYTRPRRAQMAPYIPSRARRSGWGLVACRTAPGYRVVDCQELGESPPGSGFAGALRQAAWQFRVLPPRVGGRALVGSWVRIRFDYRMETRDAPGAAEAEGEGD